MKSTWQTKDGRIQLYRGNNLELMPHLRKRSIDAVVTDPPYPEIGRDYGRMTEDDWHFLMRRVVGHCRRLLKPQGSAMFVLQPNSRKFGSMRPWLWEFLAWTAREWNQVQDAWWWNHCTLPGGGAANAGLLRGSLKACVWLGPADCYRDQDAVLWTESQANAAQRLNARAERIHHPSGHSVNPAGASAAAERRGGVTPFNVLPMGNGGSANSSGAFGHGAGTPLPLCDWWVRYISAPESIVFDPFMGAATTAVACLQRGRKFIGIEQMPKHFDAAVARVEHALAANTAPAAVLTKPKRSNAKRRKTTSSC